MARDVRLSNAFVNAQASGGVETLFNSGYVRFYSAPTTRPATADTAITDQVLLAECRFGADAIATVVNGVLTANAIVGEDSTLAPGIAAFARIAQSNGTTALMDVEVGVTGSESDIEINSVNIVAGVELNVNSFVYTITKASA
jgi:hypothetical protein